MRQKLCATGLAAVLGLALMCGCSGSKELSISELRPARGPFTGGDPVEIVGSGFKTPTPKGFSVFFGRKRARNAIIVSDTLIRVEPPGGDVGAKVNVEVVFDDSRVGKIADAYTYFDPNAEKMAL